MQFEGKLGVAYFLQISDKSKLIPMFAQTFAHVTPWPKGMICGCLYMYVYMHVVYHALVHM